MRAGPRAPVRRWTRSEEHTSELQSQSNLVCRLLLEKKKKTPRTSPSTQYCRLDRPASHTPYLLLFSPHPRSPYLLLGVSDMSYTVAIPRRIAARHT